MWFRTHSPEALRSCTFHGIFIIMALFQRTALFINIYKTLPPVLSRYCIHTTPACNNADGVNHLTICQQNAGIRKITLNNPKKRNALSLAMLTNLEQHLEDVTSDLRVIIIAAEGSVFCAGHDLKELTSDKGSEHHKKVFRKCTDVMTLIKNVPVPVIAQVQGLATAAGCQLVASCDIAIAGHSARFATPGVSVGLFCSTPGIALARAVPRKVAMEMLFTGQPISSQDALLHGLISRVVPDDKLEDEVTKIAKRICETSRSVSALGKRFFYRQIELPINDAYSEGTEVIVDNLRYVDSQEGIKAFIEKRKPQWTHSNEKAH